MTDYRIPQHDDRPERAQALGRARLRYGYNNAHGFPVATGFSDGDRPSPPWQLKALATQQELRLKQLLLKRRGHWNFVNELQPLSPFKLMSMLRDGDMAAITEYFMPIPGGAAAPAAAPVEAPTLAEYRAIAGATAAPDVVDGFDSDGYFAEKMVAGPDPTRLHRLTAVARKFPITSEHLGRVPAVGGEDLASAIAGGRVYWIDYQAMAELDNGQHPQGPKFMYAPMVAFCVPRGGGALKPFAIQCGQDPGGRIIYTPADGHSWKLAKNCVSAAHNTYHEVLTHLGFTHLISEAILLSAVRNLGAAHPVGALLRHHFEGTMSINKLAVDLLIQPGKAVEYLIGSDLKSTYPWLAKHRLQHSFRAHYLPERFARAGTGDARALPVYPYRDDGLLIWNAITGWVTDFVAGYYATDAEVRADHELAAWAAEVASGDGGQIRDFGATPGQIADRNDLVEILTMVIWTAGPQHAAVNFPQKEHSSFVPANPLAGYTPEPRGRGHSESDWLANLPPLDVAVHQLCVMAFLGSVRHTVLGDYGRAFEGTPVAEAQRRFARRLMAADEEIIARNRRRPHPYPYLRPPLIPNSTNI